ncbi:MAG: META domain-containing protein [Bacteroidia bacterium]
MKIRVILILSLFCSRLILQAQAPGIKNNTIYFLSSVFVDKKKNIMAHDKGHIVFDTKTNTAACFTSCNFIQLKFSANKNNFNFTSVTPGKDPCPDPLIGLEEDLKSILPKISSYKCIGKDLVFMNKNDTLLVFYEKEISKKP